MPSTIPEVRVYDALIGFAFTTHLTKESTT